MAEHISQTELARRINRTPRRIRHMTARGLLTRSSDGTYPWPLVYREWAAQAGNRCAPVARPELLAAAAARGVELTMTELAGLVDGGFVLDSSGVLLKAGEVCALIGITDRRLKQLEREGLPYGRTPKGQRRYPWPLVGEWINGRAARAT